MSEIQNIPSSMQPAVEQPAEPAAVETAAAEQAVPAEGGEQPAEATPQKASELLLAALKKKYEAKGFKDDEDYYSQAMADYDNEHEWAKRTRQSNEEIASKLREDPRMAAFIIDLMNGKSPKQAALNLPDGFFELDEEDEAYKAYQDALAANKEQEARDAQAVADYEANLKASEDVVNEYAKQTGRSAEDIDKFINDFNERFITPMLQGKLTTEILSVIDKGLGYDEDVAKAEEAGKIAGRNETIVEKQRQMDAINGSGLPDAHGGSAMVKAEPNDRDRQALAFAERLGIGRK